MTAIRGKPQDVRHTSKNKYNDFQGKNGKKYSSLSGKSKCKKFAFEQKVSYSVYQKIHNRIALNSKIFNNNSSLFQNCILYKGSYTCIPQTNPEIMQFSDPTSSKMSWITSDKLLSSTLASS